MLAAERSISKLHIVGSLDVIVGKSKRPIIPGVVSILEPGTQVDDFSSWFGSAEASAD